MKAVFLAKSGVLLLFYEPRNFVLSLFLYWKLKRKGFWFVCLFFGYFVPREKRSAIIPLISFSPFPEISVGFSCLLPNRLLIQRRDCNDLKGKRNVGRDLSVSSEKKPSLLTHSQLFAILFVVPFIYLFSFFCSFFRKSFDCREKIFLSPYGGERGYRKRAVLAHDRPTLFVIGFLGIRSFVVLSRILLLLALLSVSATWLLDDK